MGSCDAVAKVFSLVAMELLGGCFLLHFKRSFSSSELCSLDTARVRSFCLPFIGFSEALRNHRGLWRRRCETSVLPMLVRFSTTNI